MISRGFADGGESSSARKAHLRSIKSGETPEIQAVSKLPRLDTTITFSNSNMEGCQHPHDDPLVISRGQQDSAQGSDRQCEFSGHHIHISV